MYHFVEARIPGNTIPSNIQVLPYLKYLTYALALGSPKSYYVELMTAVLSQNLGTL